MLSVCFHGNLTLPNIANHPLFRKLMIMNKIIIIIIIIYTHFKFLNGSYLYHE